MYLAYTDEAGINYRITDNKFHDGPYVLFGSLAIHESKYFVLERIFLDLISEYFSISDWRTAEIHATDIWNHSGIFSDISEQKAKSFFEEVIQLATKLNLTFLLGFYGKTADASTELQNSQIFRAVYALLHNIEKFLSDHNESGVIISDRPNNSGTSGEPHLSKLLTERIEWRFGAESEKTIVPKFKYEARSSYILDSVHYVDSGSSMFNQIADVVLYVCKRVFTYYRLKKYGEEVDLSRVPVSIETFDMFCGECLRLTSYSELANDVSFYTPIRAATPLSPIQIGGIYAIQRFLV